MGTDLVWLVQRDVAANWSLSSVVNSLKISDCITNLPGFMTAVFRAPGHYGTAQSMLMGIRQLPE